MFSEAEKRTIDLLIHARDRGPLSEEQELALADFQARALKICSIDEEAIAHERVSRILDRFDQELALRTPVMFRGGPQVLPRPVLESLLIAILAELKE